MYQVAVAKWNTPNEFNVLSCQMCFILVPEDQTIYLMHHSLIQGTIK